jgi:hypothetical protein
MRIATRRNESGNLVIDVIDVETLEDYEKTISILVDRLGGKLLDRIVGPDDTATSFVRIGRCVLLLDLVDMIGMVITVSDNSAEQVAMNVVDLLRQH